MSDTRQAALTLHALSAQDRDWVLSRLTDEQRSELTGYLDELVSLGIPRDSGLIQAAMANVPPVQSALQGLPARGLLAKASGATMYAVLEEEPAWLMAQVLKAGPWSWQADFMSRLPESRRRALAQSLIEASAIGEKVVDAMLNKLALRLTSLPNVVTANPNGAPNHDKATGWVTWIRKWIP
ncbi:hypothetical protein [Parachitinimonas caeni]|uniref:Uncharacterized protein n=1 Tax=Parachitinimonas caeni TaxID=3031301 RepID=A0ABT7DZ65_9NEIS|nr:hypothetical protein [Parachitinimonas caeni]MDK2125124.1 hypothetical protein [Parachitinimonas caeni]